MKFPIINISHRNPVEEEDLLIYSLTEALIYTDNEKVFKEFYENQFFCDAEGRIFECTKRILPTSGGWRSAFKFLPNTYKVQLVFKATGKTLDKETLRSALLNRAEKVEDSDFVKFYKEYIKKADSWEQLIIGEQLN